MNTLNFCQVERRNFGELLSVEGVSRLNLTSARDFDSLLHLSLAENSVVAVWPQDPGMGNQLPALLVCKDGTEEDWAAWITTFGAKIRPFSAFMRLITRSEFENLATGARTPTLDRLTWPVAGLILGEVLAASHLPDKSLESLPANASESTLSFAMFRAAATYSSFRQWDQLVDAWELVRQATRQHLRPVESASVANVCRIIMAAAKLSDAPKLLNLEGMRVAEACREVITSPGYAPLGLSTIPQFSSIEERMHGPREDRVVAFSEFVRTIGSPASADGELTPLMLGYLASRIAPGTIQHSSVLGPVTHRHATALLWYGFCAGLGGAEGSTRNGIGGTRSAMDLPASARRVARDLLRPEPLLAAPTCDIAYLELLALSRSDNDPLAGLIRTTQGTARIELAPAVCTVVNVPSKSGIEGLGRSGKERKLLAAMREDLEHLVEGYNELVGSDPAEAGQRSLFRAKPKKP
jgi:hypothetical protein